VVHGSRHLSRWRADLFDAFKDSTGDAHPPYPTRVWALNGSLSTLARQGHVAAAVRRAAERMACAADRFNPELDDTRMSAGASGSTKVLAALQKLIKPAPGDLAEPGSAALWSGTTHHVD
jgi:hypothetical protein